MSNSRALAHLSALPNARSWLGVGEYRGPSIGTGTTVGYTAPSQGGVVTIGSANTPGTVIIVDDVAFLSVDLSSNTTSFAVTKVDNRALATPSYTFASSNDQYTKIFSAQCDRVSNFIFGQLQQLDRSDEDQNETVVDGIANVISLMGEPAAYTALFEANFLKSDPTVLEPLLFAIATAHHDETEADRVEMLKRYAGDVNYRVRRAAVRALGRMGTKAARNALREIGDSNAGTEMGRLAIALLR